MEMKVIKKNDFNKLIDSIIKNNYTFYGPVKTEDSINILEFNNKNKITLNYNNIKIPVKKYFLPESEVLFTYKGNRNSHTNTTLEDEKSNDQIKVIFGLRPCDTRSIAYLNKVLIPFFTKTD